MILKFAEIYRAFFRISVLNQIQYRASGMIWMIGAVIEPVVFLVVWSTVSKSQGEAIEGYGPQEFAAYYLVLMLVSHLTFAWIMHVFQFRIQYGSLSFELLRPVHPIHADISDNLAYKLVMMIVMVPSVVLVWWLFEPRFELELWSTLTFVPVLILAFLLRFTLEWTLALAAFWTTRVTAINQIYFSVQMFLAGRIAPIALLPLFVQDLATALPFYYTVAFPVELFLGRVEPGEAAASIGVQLLWLAFAFVLLAFTWRRAVKKFSAVGS